MPALERKRDESKGPAKSRPKKQKKKKAHDDEWREEDTSDEESSDEDTSTAEEVEVFSDATSEDYEPQPAIPRSRGMCCTACAVGGRTWRVQDAVVHAIRCRLVSVLLAKYRGSHAQFAINWRGWVQRLFLLAPKHRPRSRLPSPVPKRR